MALSQSELEHQLESLMDTQGVSLSEILSTLVTICSEKAVHIETSYNDRMTARPWKKAAQRISIIADSIDL